MLYAEQIDTGHGPSTVLMSCDYETYSEAGYAFDGKRWRPFKKNSTGIAIVGAWAYSEHPSTEVLCFAYDLKDGRGKQLWRPGEPNPEELFARLAQGYKIEAVNSFFEYCIWNNVCCRLYGWPPLHIDSILDVAAKAGAFTLPRKLSKMAAILGAATQKDAGGTTIMRKVSKPRSPSKNDARQRFTPADAPEDFAKLYAYCKTDVQAEDDCSDRLPDLSPLEQLYFQIDQRINARGVAIDLETVAAARLIITQAQNRYFAELQTLTGGAVKTSDAIAQIKTWVASRGVFAASLDKPAIVELLKSDKLPDDVRRVLKIRQIMGSKSVAKANAITWRVGRDGRIRDLYTYAGAARTRRWAGGGVQPQNLPSGGPPVSKCSGCSQIYWSGLKMCPTCFCPVKEPAEWGAAGAEACIEAIRTGNLNTLEALWGDPFTAISGCLRALFIAGPGCELISSDFSAIEAVVLAELAGETWMQEVFRTHGKIYEMTASRITGTPFAEFARYKEQTGMDHPYRKLGKVGSLASGFGGWIKAWIKFGADEFMSEDEMKQAILSWRAEAPNIVKFWKEMEGNAIKAVRNPGESFTYRGITYKMHHDTLYCFLPSGRPIVYHTPRVDDVERNGRIEPHLTYAGLDLHKNWVRLDTYGGKLTENIVQAIARDIFAAAMLRIEAAGYPIVLHTHDEITCEIPEGSGNLLNFEALMSLMELWCAGWPVRADGGWRGKRNRK